MDKIAQMDELILKVQKDAELQKEIAVVLQAENPEDTSKADQWLADNGYEFTLRELVEHLEGGFPLSDDQLEAVAGGRNEDGTLTSGEAIGYLSLFVGIGAIEGLLRCF